MPVPPFSPSALCCALLWALQAPGSSADSPAGGQDPSDDLGVEATGPPPIWFRDGTADSGLAKFRNRSGSAGKDFITDSFGAGVALLDFDRDGALDVFLVGGGQHDSAGVPQGAGDRLFAGDGTGRFRDVSKDAGLATRAWSYGVRTGDLDGDGWVDLFVTCLGHNVFWRNRGDGTFEDRTAAAGFLHSEWSTGAAVFDYDRDGDLDLWVVGHIAFDRAAVIAAERSDTFLDQPVYAGPRGLPPLADRLYQNQGDGTFVDVSEAAGLAAHPSVGFQAVILDVDADGWSDVYVANDSRPNQLWRNKGDGTFAEVAGDWGAALSLDGEPQASMGVAVGDPTGDGRLDLFVTNFSGDTATFYCADPEGRFRDETLRAGLAQATVSSLGWGALFADFDADGDEDLFAANGHVYPQMERLVDGPGYFQPDQIFENLGSGRFRSPPEGGGPGVTAPGSSRGVAAGDVDGDGDLDLVVGRLDGAPVLLLNEGGDRGGVVIVELEGKGRNTAALGTRIEAHVKGRAQVCTVGTQQGFLSSHGAGVHLGLGKARSLDELIVRWPDGTVSRMHDVPAGRRVRLRQGTGPLDMQSLERR